MIGFIIFYFSWLVWSRSNKTHISNKHIKKLRNLINRIFFYKFSYFCFSWIIMYLIKRSISLTFFLNELFFKFECFVFIFIYSITIFYTVFPFEIAKFIEIKNFSILSNSSISVYDRSRKIIKFY